MRVVDRFAVQFDDLPELIPGRSDYRVLFFLLDPSNSDARRLIHGVARITHRNDEASVGALALVFGIRRALEGLGARSEMLASIAESLADTQVRDQILLAASLGDVQAADAASLLGSSGFVVESVPLALYLGLQEWTSPVDALETAALVSDDPYTVASMVGHLLGAAGHSLPEEENLPDLGVDVMAIAERIAAVAFDTGSGLLILEKSNIFRTWLRTCSRLQMRLCFLACHVSASVSL